MASRFAPFIRGLAETEVPSSAFNEYAKSGDLAPANAVRRRNLDLYLRQLDELQCDTMLVGEAPSYRGCRLTGVPFVSERIMLEGVSIGSRADRTILGAAAGYRLCGETDRPSTEASATMVWGTIRAIEPLPLLWNAFPFHPFQAGNRNSNRMPAAGELAIGSRFVEWLLELFAIRRVIAVGNRAEASLLRLGVEHTKVRHPSQGGKGKFVEGVRDILTLCRL